MQNALKVAIALGMFFTSLGAMAHPGHGELAGSGGLAAGFMHPMLGADHLLAALAVGVIAVRMRGCGLWTLPAIFVASMLLGAVLAYSGFYLPLLKPMLAASVLVLGLVITWRAPKISPAALLVGGFAVVHGVAHAAGIPANMSMATVSFTAGFVMATTLLHAIGVAVGLACSRWPHPLTGAPIAVAGGWLLILAVV